MGSLGDLAVAVSRPHHDFLFLSSSFSPLEEHENTTESFFNIFSVSLGIMSVHLANFDILLVTCMLGRLSAKIFWVVVDDINFDLITIVVFLGPMVNLSLVAYFFVGVATLFSWNLIAPPR